ncbi:S-adenosyl-L-methionine-dependent methyltransferase [Scenedesmus sp. NREL 46B-D3]|nr:S-adenosyl-L-methionine-dependent methyltransferase [Scenedesmus sp. NREL 46B-D3]
MSQVTTGVQLGEAEAVRASVSKYYGETLQASSDLKTSACCTAKAPPADVLAVLRQLPQEIIQKYYGCGSPFPAGLKGSGLRVLDLGCGTGRDCYVCAALVGEEGFVTGLDMTPAQLEVAQRHSAAWQQQLGYAALNMRFLQGKIEELAAAGIAAGSMDLIISNCVINLSPDKAAVLGEAYQALADGGEVFFSDVYCDRRLPAAVRSHEVLLGECLGGALAVNDFLRLAHQVGFADPRVLEVEPIAVHDPELKALLGDAAFYSITFRLFKLPGQLEALPEEDYGQTATYKGSMSGCEAAYVLDSVQSFPTGTAVRVSGNTAAMLASSWLKPHFAVTGDTSQHLGQFAGTSSALSAASIAALAAASGSSDGGSCCPPKRRGCSACTGNDEQLLPTQAASSRRQQLLCSKGASGTK